MHDLLLITPSRIGDHRGYFEETYSRRHYTDLGIEAEFVQDNYSISNAFGTLRGLHFQAPPHAQIKLVRCGRGAIFDVAVDIRRSSPTFGGWVGETLSSENKKQLWVPPGFAHGFLTLEENCEIFYKTSNYYSFEHDVSLAYFDKKLKIDLPCSLNEMTMSNKDINASMLEEIGEVFK